MTDFLDLPLFKPFVETLASKGIIELTPIQEKVIPLALEGKSVFFESETGTGKTFAFLLPLLTRLMQDEKKSSAPRILILSPTVELASQIKEAAAQLQETDNKYFKTLLCVGGSSLKRQIEGLKEKPSVIIGTPARISDLIGLKKLKLREIAAMVIDEADRQLARESRDALHVRQLLTEKILNCLTFFCGVRQLLQCRNIFPLHTPECCKSPSNIGLFLASGGKKPIPYAHLSMR